MSKVGVCAAAVAPQQDRLYQPKQLQRAVIATLVSTRCQCGCARCGWRGNRFPLTPIFVAIHVAPCGIRTAATLRCWRTQTNPGQVSPRTHPLIGGRCANHTRREISYQARSVCIGHRVWCNNKLCQIHRRPVVAVNAPTLVVAFVFCSALTRPTVRVMWTIRLCSRANVPPRTLYPPRGTFTFDVTNAAE
jgi:hypothetical protein